MPSLTASVEHDKVTGAADGPQRNSSAASIAPSPAEAAAIQIHVGSLLTMPVQPFWIESPLTVTAIGVRPPVPRSLAGPATASPVVALNRLP